MFLLPSRMRHFVLFESKKLADIFSHQDLHTNCHEMASEIVVDGCPCRAGPRA